MKKVLSILVFSLFLISAGCSQTVNPESNNEKNDVVISETQENNTIITTYRHIQDLYGFEKSYIVYETPSENNKLFDLADSTAVKILQIQVQHNSKTDTESVWYEIEAKNRIGWIKTDYNPYQNGRWSIIETVKLDGVEKTVRKASGKYKLLTSHDKGELITLYSAPSAKSEVIFTTSKNEESVTVIAMTDEPELCKTYSNYKEYWVKICLNEKEGWIFGSQLDSGRGGPKYYDIPENAISNSLEVSLA